MKALNNLVFMNEDMLQSVVKKINEFQKDAGKRVSVAPLKKSDFLRRKNKLF